MQTSIKIVPVEMVTSKLLEVAKASNIRDWEIHDQGYKGSLLHHTVDDLLDFIHTLNGVPEEEENGFCRDNWDDDFISYFYGDIDLDECMRRYGERLEDLSGMVVV